MDYYFFESHIWWNLFAPVPKTEQCGCWPLAEIALGGGTDCQITNFRNQQSGFRTQLSKCILEDRQNEPSCDPEESRRATPASVLISEQGCAHRECTGVSLLYIIVMGTKPDVLLLLGMLMLGMALGALLTLIRQKAITKKTSKSLRQSCECKKKHLTREQRMIRQCRMQHNGLVQTAEVPAGRIGTSPTVPYRPP